MSLTYGFYNSKNKDRRYTARQMSQIFDGLITDGVFMTIGDCFAVKASSGMTVSVGVGRAWFNHTWSYNDSKIIVDVEPSNVLFDRIDTLVLEIDETETVRANAIKWIVGTPATNPVAPTLTNTELVHQYPLCDHKVPANSTAVSQANITNRVGTSDCPFVTGILEGMDIDNLIAQWGAQWDDWSDEKMAEFETWFTAIKEQFSEIEVDENGIYEYAHTADGLTGTGVNGKFKSITTGTYSSIDVNGVSYTVKCGEDSEIDLVEGSWYTFILDGETINFKQGGAGLNFKMVDGTTFPKSTNANLIVYPYYHTTQTVNGITFTDNGDGTITVNGTATADAVFRLSMSDDPTMNHLPAGTYTLGGCPSGGDNSTYLLQCWDHVNSVVLANNIGATNTFTVEEDCDCRIAIVVRSGATMSDITFWPRLVEGDTDPGFIKYAQKENMFFVNTEVPITSWDFRTSEPPRRSITKNLIGYPFNKTTLTQNGITFTDNGDGTVTANGTATASAYFYLTTGLKNSNVRYPSGKYTLSGCPADGSQNTYYLQLYNETDENIMRDCGDGVTVTLDKNKFYRIVLVVAKGQTVSDLTFKPQLEKGSVATEFVKGDCTGQVWIKLALEGSVKFNALKKNGIILLPVYCMQWSGSAWIEKVLYCFQNETWNVCEYVSSDDAVATVTEGDMLDGVTAYDKNGVLITGTIPTYWTKKTTSICLYNNCLYYQNIPIGYYTGTDNDNQPEIYATYADVASTIGLTADKLVTGNTILGVAGTSISSAGGSFTGNVVAYSTNRTTSGLRNIEVRSGSATGTLQSTNKIIMVRK